MDETTPIDEGAISRRGALLKLGGLAASAVGASVWGARGLLSTDDARAAGTGPADVASGLVACVLTPETTEGPYFLEGDKVRRNITEGKTGVPLFLRLAVVEVPTCTPIRNAAVDVWHCDARGVYSGTQSESFLRGIQRTDRSGLARFTTIYPGWYPGRTVHIHVRVYVGGRTVHTGQLFFPDAVTDLVYRRAPYSRRPDRDPRNAGDPIFRSGGRRSLLKLSRSGRGYLGALTMGVRRS